MRKTRKAKNKKSNKKLFVTISASVIAVIVSLSVFLVVTAAPSATGTKYFYPSSYAAGTNPGSALVVYDPGANKAAENVASQMASDLQGDGYFVWLAGIDSATAKGNASQYQVVVVGGPLDNGKASGSVQSYLSNLFQANGTVIGVFGVGNSNASNNQIAPLSSGSNLTIKETVAISPSQDTAPQSSEFVSKLLS